MFERYTMRFGAGLFALAVVAAGCSSAPARRVTAVGAPPDVSTSTAVEPTTTSVSGAPVTTAAPVTTTTARTALTPFVGAVATTTTTRATAAQASVTTTPADPTTTAAPSPSTTAPPTTSAPTTTTTLRQLSALNLSASCDEASPGKPSNGVMAVSEAVDLDKLRSDLAAQGYALPSGFQFKWGGTHALTPATERNLNDAQAKIDQCAADSGGSATLTVWRVQGEQGSDLFAGMVKQQLDDLHFKNHKSTTVS